MPPDCRASPNLSTSSAVDVHVARQPILDRSLRLYGYELLFRPSGTARSAGDMDPNLMASQVILGALGEIGLEGLVGQHLAFVNMTRDLLVSGAHEVLPVESTVIELLEDVPADDDVVEAVRDLKRRGYIIALDDFIFAPELEPLVELADIVKLDVLDVDPAEVERAVEQLRPYGVKLLAERVETHEVFARCRDLGFDYFQGYFFARPQIVHGRSLPNGQVSALELLRLLNDPGTEFDELEAVVSRDVSLSYRLLRHLNSPALGLRRRITSIREALVLLGERNVRKWATLVVFGTVGGSKPSALIKSAQVRARMCEQLANAGERVQGAAAFTAGLFSLLDALLDRPIELAIEPLGLDAELRVALTDLRGPLGDLLAVTLAWECGDWEQVAVLRERVDLADEVLRRCAFDAFQWVEALSET
jgi:c-di-GMP phosphodiesterase